MRSHHQRGFDRTGRLVYMIKFPADVPVDRAIAEIRTLPASIRLSKSGLVAPTMVFESISRGGTFEFRIRVPSDKAEYIVAQLRAAIPGITVEPVLEGDQALGEFNAGFEVGMNLPDHQVEMGGRPADVAVSLLNSFNPVGDEVVVMQWVIAGSQKVKLPATDDSRVRSTDFSFFKALAGHTEASRDELTSRRAKVDTEPNFIAGLRIAADSRHHDRSAALCHNLIMAMKASDGPKVKFVYREIKRDLTDSVNEAWTPLQPRLQLAVSELVPRLGWPLGSDYIEGVSRAAFRHLPPANDIATDGIVIGVSTMPGSERRIALPLDGLRTHAYLGGATEVGKTTLGTNILRQHIERGGGAVIIERDGDLIHRTLNQVRHEDLDRVINIDFTDAANFVGVNPFNFENPMQIATKLAELFERIYKINGVNLRKILFHGIPALAETGDATLLDLIPLVDPKSPADARWSRDRIAQLKTRELKEFFKDWGAKSADRRSKDMEPVLNRFWELTLDPQISRMLNHTQSTIDLGAAIRDNKIVCVNLKGVDSRLAEVVGSLMVSWIWDLSAKNIPADHDNLLFLDEAHLFSHLEGTIVEMLATARKRKLGVVMATQYIGQLSVGIQRAISTNARTKIIMQSGPDSAKVHRDEFAAREVTAEMFQNLEKYTAIAKIKLPQGGVSAPLTMRTLAEPPSKGNAHRAIAQSNGKYARTVAHIEADQRARRQVETKGRQTVDIGDEPVIGDWKGDF